MKTLKVRVPDGKRAEWINGVLTLVDERSALTDAYSYKALDANGVLSGRTYDTWLAAEEAAGDGGRVVKVPRKKRGLHLPSLSVPSWLTFDRVLVTAGLLIAGYGICNLIASDNDSGMRLDLTICIIFAGGLLTVLGAAKR